MSHVIPFSLPRETARSSIWTLEAIACWLLVVLLVFLNSADFRGSTGSESFEVHWQVRLRILISLSSGAVAALLLFPKAYRDFLSWPGFLTTLTILWLGICLPFSIEKTYCTAAWICLACVSLFVPTAMRVLGAWGTVSAIALGLLLFVIGSWIAYIYFPVIGVFHEQISMTDTFERMGGLAHPNELGFHCAFAIILFTAMGMSGRLPWIIVAPCILLSIAALLQCYSRTAFAVTCLGLIVTMQNYWRSNVALPLAAALLAFVVSFGAIAFGNSDRLIDNMLRKISKSGDAKELTTVTGRDVIWKYGIARIKESPVFGYGYGATRFVMVNHSFHCHNILLNAMMGGGLLAGLLMAAQCLYALWGMIFQPRYEVDGLASCFLVGGVIEGLLSAATPSAHIVIWIMVLFWRQLNFSLAPQPIPSASGAEL